MSVRRVVGIALLFSSRVASGQPDPTAPPADLEPAPGVEPAPPPGTTSADPPPVDQPPAAPAPASPGRSLGIDGAVVVPMSDYADEAKVGFGALVRFEFPRSDVFAFTVRAGGLFHVAAEDRDTLLLFPAYVGIKLAFADPWFASADAGLTFKYQGEAGGALGLAFGAGYRKGKLSARAEILVPDLGLADSTAGVMASLGLAL